MEEFFFHTKLDNNYLKHSARRFLGVNLNSRVFVRISQQDESVGGKNLLKPSRAFFLNALLFVLFSVFLNGSLCQQPQRGVSLLSVWLRDIIPCCSKARRKTNQWTSHLPCYSENKIMSVATNLPKWKKHKEPVYYTGALMGRYERELMELCVGFCYVGFLRPRWAASFLSTDFMTGNTERTAPPYSLSTSHILEHVLYSNNQH